MKHYDLEFTPQEIALAKTQARKTPNPYTPHRRQHREAMFVRCLLVNGPPPPLPYSRETIGGAGAYEIYKTEIREYWVSTISSSPAPKMKAAHRFQKRFMYWCRQEQRRIEEEGE